MTLVGEVCLSSPIRAQAHCSGAFFEEVVWRVSINRPPFVQKIVDITVLSCSILCSGSQIEDAYFIMPMLGPAGAMGLSSDYTWYDSTIILRPSSSDQSLLRLKTLNNSASRVILLRMEEQLVEMFCKTLERN